MKVKRLTQQAENDRAEFESLGSCCSCHINPPCGYCIHEGNPLNQEENEDCWEYIEDES